jgi:hypothetical protein
MKNRTYLAGLLFAMVIQFHAATASSLEFGLDKVLSGATPAGTAPWVTMTFTDLDYNNNNLLDDGVVQLVIDTSGLELQSGQFLKECFFNVNFNGNLDFLWSAPQIESAIYSSNSVGNGEGIVSGFDIGVLFYESNSDNGLNRFDAGETISLLMAGQGLTADLFDTVNLDGYFAAAHVLGIPYGDGSGKIVDSNSPTPSPVPEPATMLLLGFGLMGLALIGRRLH